MTYVIIADKLDTLKQIIRLSKPIIWRANNDLKMAILVAAPFAGTDSFATAPKEDLEIKYCKISINNYLDVLQKIPILNKGLNNHEDDEYIDKCKKSRSSKKKHKEDFTKKNVSTSQPLNAYHDNSNFHEIHDTPKSSPYVSPIRRNTVDRKLSNLFHNESKLNDVEFVNESFPTSPIADDIVIKPQCGLKIRNVFRDEVNSVFVQNEESINSSLLNEERESEEKEEQEKEELEKKQNDQLWLETERRKEKYLRKSIENEKRKREEQRAKEELINSLKCSAIPIIILTILIVLLVRLANNVIK